MTVGAVSRTMRLALMLVAAMAVSACSTTGAGSPAPPSAQTMVSTTAPSASPTTAHSTEPLPSSTPPVPTNTDGFPTQALGIPVISIAELNHQIEAGQLDGRVSAVRGFLIMSMQPSCPAPDRWYSPLEGYCGVQIFSDTAYPGSTCTKVQNGISCSSNGPPVGAEVVHPFMLDGASFISGSYPKPEEFPDGFPMVVIGHAGDPRFLQCGNDVRDSCRRSFVVDSIAWVAGQPSDLSLADYLSHPRLSVKEVADIVGGRPISLFAGAARDISGIDPRIHLAGGDLTWLVRTVDTEAADQPAGAYVYAVDDSIGSVLADLTLEVPNDYAPAFLSLQATDANDCCGGNSLSPLFRVSKSGGAAALEGYIGGGAVSGTDQGGSRWYPGGPALLDPGEYELAGWRAQVTDSGDWGVPTDQCATTINVSARTELRLQADFPVKGSCTWGPTTFDEPYH
jgi:hypothetical protein